MNETLQTEARPRSNANVAQAAQRVELLVSTLYDDERKRPCDASNVTSDGAGATLSKNEGRGADPRSLTSHAFDTNQDRIVDEIA